MSYERFRSKGGKEEGKKEGRKACLFFFVAWEYYHGWEKREILYVCFYATIVEDEKEKEKLVSFSPEKVVFWLHMHERVINNAD